MAFADRGRPQHHNVDTFIGNAIVPQRSCNPTDGMVDIPGPEPRADPLLEIGNDLVGDATIDVTEGAAHGGGPFGLDTRRVRRFGSVRMDKPTGPRGDDGWRAPAGTGGPVLGRALRRAGQATACGGYPASKLAARTACTGAKSR